jgi:hypothetical protein
MPCTCEHARIYTTSRAYVDTIGGVGASANADLHHSDVDALLDEDVQCQ